MRERVYGLKNRRSPLTAVLRERTIFAAVLRSPAIIEAAGIANPNS